MSLLRITAVSGLMAFACAAQASTVTFVDFEPSTYTAGQTINAGEDGWIRYAPGNGAVTPDAGSGYTPGNGYPILSGTQSFIQFNGGYGHGWGSASGLVANQFNTSFLIREADASSSGTFGIYFSDSLTALATPGGVEFNQGTGKIDVFGKTGTVSNGVSFSAATTYKVEFDVNLPANSFDAFVTDLTNSGPRTLAGTGLFYGSGLSLPAVQSGGGLVFYRYAPSAPFIFDNLQVSSIPEPASMAGVMAAGLLLKRRRNSVG